MSLVSDLATYIAANSSLVVDTDLFVGGDVVDTPSGSVIVRELPGSTKNWSGMEDRIIQLLALDLGYINAETLLNTVYDLLANKPGLNTVADLFFVEVVSMPGIIDRDVKGNYIFGTTLLVRKS